jgi:hypothetical protein
MIAPGILFRSGHSRAHGFQGHMILQNAGLTRQRTASALHFGLSGGRSPVPRTLARTSVLGGLKLRAQPGSTLCRTSRRALGGHPRRMLQT